jgi:hypothetical protein
MSKIENPKIVSKKALVLVICDENALNSIFVVKNIVTDFFYFDLKNI